MLHMIGLRLGSGSGLGVRFRLGLRLEIGFKLGNTPSTWSGLELGLGFRVRFKV